MQLREKGIALIITLLTMVVVAGIGTLLFARTVNEMQHSRDDAAIVQTLLLARGGANLGGAVLDGPVKAALNAIVEDSDTIGRWSFGSSSVTETQPTPSSVADDLTKRGGASKSVAELLQEDIDDAVCDQAVTPADSNASVQIYIFVTDRACGDQSLPGGIKLPAGRFVSGSPRTATKEAASQIYAIPFVMVSEATQGAYKRNVVLQGEYRFTVGRNSFARYALFTNRHRTQDNDAIWFTDATLFDGPVHSNEFFNFFREPWFGGQVTSAGCSDIRTRINTVTLKLEEYCRKHDNRGANFFGEGFIEDEDLNSPTNPSYTNGNGTHAPIFSAGVSWAEEFIALPVNSFDQRDEAQKNGLLLTKDLYSLTLWAADANGDALSPDGQGGWKPAASFQYIESCEKKANGSKDACTIYRYGADGKLYKYDTKGKTWQLERDPFNGVIFSDGKLERFNGPARTTSNINSAPPALASFAQITLASNKTIRITGDLKYESPPCTGSPTRGSNRQVTAASCNNLEARNVLGIYVQDEDILIGNNNSASSKLNAPNDITIQGVLMSSKGIVGVENYNSGSPRGDVNLLGGVIENFYGGFGTFNSNTGARKTGYGRRFTYDQRMYSDVSPPYFPTVGRDSLQGTVLFSFGQREQLY